MGSRKLKYSRVTAKEDLARAQLYAPIDDTVLSVTVEEGMKFVEVDFVEWTDRFGVSHVDWVPTGKTAEYQFCYPGNVIVGTGEIELIDWERFSEIDQMINQANARFDYLSAD